MGWSGFILKQMDTFLEFLRGRTAAGVDTRGATDIRAINAEIGRIVARQQELRTAIDVIVADLEGAA